MNLVPALLAAASVLTVRVDADPAHVRNTVSPLRAIGMGVDSEPRERSRCSIRPRW
jgi:hypothetical protein